MLSNSTDRVNNLLNQLAYVNIKDNWKPGENLIDVVRRSGGGELADQLEEAGLSNLVIKDYANENTTNGFGGIAFADVTTGETGISFRGTQDMNDWLDNASTAVTGDSAQAQRALEFYRKNRSSGGEVFLYGHSKGGELAAQVYAQYYREIAAAHVINPQPIDWAKLTPQQKAAFNNGKFDAVVVDGDFVWLLGGVPYKVRIIENNKSQNGIVGPHDLKSATYDENGRAVIETDPYKDYKGQGVLGFSLNSIITAVQGGYRFISSLFLKAEFVTRDFSERSKQQLLNLVSEVENEKWCDFTDWVGDRWYDFEGWIGSLDIRRYINNVNEYHKKVIDKNNTSKETIEKIFAEVTAIDTSYGTIFGNILQQQKNIQQYIRELGEIIYPANGRFTASGMSSLDNLLGNITAQRMECFRDQLVQDIDGRVVINEELLYEYVKKNPAQISDAEKAVLLDTISLLKDTVAVYETLASVGTDELGADILNYVRWISDSTEFESFTAVSAHYNDIYVNLLNYMQEQSEDANTFAASLLTAGIGESTLTLLGVETYENLKEIFGKNSNLKVYLAKYESEHSEQYFLKLEESEKLSLKASGKFKNLSDALKDKDDQLSDYLKDKGLFKEDKDTHYYKDGKEIDEAEAPSFYKRQVTLAEIKKEAKAKVSIYEGKFDTPLGGELSVTVGEAEAHANIAGGLYVVGKKGERVFSPGVSAEIGASVTALQLDYENQLLGDEMLGLNVDGSVVVGEASAKASGEINFMGKDKDGNIVFDPQVNVGVKAEAVAFKAEGSAGVNVLGGEVGVKGSVKVGVGVNADVGYKDGVFKCELGASLGIGFDVGFEVDVGGMVNTVADAASSAWNGIKDGWNKFWGGW